MEMRSFRSAWRIALACGVVLILFNLFPFYDLDQARRADTAKRVHRLRSRLKDYYAPGHNHDAATLNYMALDHLAGCLEANDCLEGQEKVIIITSHHFSQARVGMMAGEEIWAHSMQVALDSLHHTVLYALGDSEMSFIYQSIPDLVVLAYMEPETLDDCLARDNNNYLDLRIQHAFPTDWQRPGRHGCAKRPGYEEGIPVWKLMGWGWWEGPVHPLGRLWSVAPEDWGHFKHNDGNTYLGYSVEDRCKLTPFVPHDQREHRGLTLAKRAEYFTSSQSYAWPGILPSIASKMPVDDKGNKFEFVATASGTLDPELAVRNIGLFPRDKWLQEVAKSKFMLAVGRPYLSPSPYDALCFGVPFINVLYSRDEKNPENRKEWRTQHDALKFIDPPYVYHIHEKSEAELDAAIRAILKNPIDRYIPEPMTLESVRSRHVAMIERDWRSEAASLFPQMFGPDKPFLL